MIEARWAEMWESTRLGGRDRRASVRAVACLDCALWDAQGKRLKAPLRKLWGGARTRISRSPSPVLGDPPQEVANVA